MSAIVFDCAALCVIKFVFMLIFFYSLAMYIVQCVSKALSDLLKGYEVLQNILRYSLFLHAFNSGAFS